eukprot:CAMPEP_0185723216 /NCGR_PEP_ID=MMETSP1171-20130828/127_1 /TAXON_ID=374046 /ORGANISM="Helicotheca tamensis, Strain CCMP826" /LENGTH=193 /DNA_ID=CAMNT_0028390885 /DNA_START=73 /DNA_END=651 /DNA_ORIENTATION=+
MRFFIAALLISSVAEGASVRGSSNLSLHDIDLDPSCFKAAWSADNAEEACANAVAQSGESCVWCSYLEDAVGACVSSDQSSILAEYMHCGEDKSRGSVEASAPSPDVSCLMVNIEGADAQTCADTTSDSGDACSWCTMQGYGACVGPEMASWMKDNAGDYGVTCGDEVEVEASAPSPDVSCLMVNIEGADAQT